MYMKINGCTKPNAPTDPDYGQDFDPITECPDRLIDHGRSTGHNSSIVTVRCNNTCPHHEGYATWQKNCARYALITDCWSRNLTVMECLSFCLIYGYVATTKYIEAIYLIEECAMKQHFEEMK